MNSTQKDITVLNLVALEFPQNSRASIRKWIRMGRILVDGRCIQREMDLVSPDQKIELGKKDISPYPFKVLFEDSDLIVVHKPDFLLSVATLDPKERNVHDCLKKELRPAKVYPVHRLDREVSGPLIFAKSKRCYELLREAFYEKQVGREYKALIHGALNEQKGIWESYLVEKKNYKVHTTEQQGKHAVTHFDVEDSNEGASLITLTLDTGRKNQLRVHCQKSGHSILGDKKYGNFEDDIANLALFAHTLDFTHPITGKQLNFKVEPPPFFKRLLSQHKLKMLA